VALNRNTGGAQERKYSATIGIAIAHDNLVLTGYLGIALVLAGTAWGRSIEQCHRLRDHTADSSQLRTVIPEEKLPSHRIIDQEGNRLAVLGDVRRANR
jgi:hypothetical protein